MSHCGYAEVLGTQIFQSPNVRVLSAETFAVVLLVQNNFLLLVISTYFGYYWVAYDHKVDDVVICIDGWLTIYNQRAFSLYAAS